MFSFTLITWLWPLFSLTLIAWPWPLFLLTSWRRKIHLCWSLFVKHYVDFVLFYFGDCVIYISLVREQLKSYLPVSLSCTPPVLDSIYLFGCRLYTFVHNTHPISIRKIAEENFYKWTNILLQDLQGKEMTRNHYWHFIFHMSTKTFTHSRGNKTQGVVLNLASNKIHCRSILSNLT